MKSKTPIARNIIVNIDEVVGFAKISMSIIFIDIRKMVPVKIRLVTIRKPPIAILSLTSFCNQFTPLVARDSILSRQYYLSQI